MNSGTPLTVLACRRADHWLWVACGRCQGGRILNVHQIPDRFAQATVRDLHFAGRFRCAECGSAARATMVYTSCRHAAHSMVERWAEDVGPGSAAKAI